MGSSSSKSKKKSDKPAKACKPKKVGWTQNDWKTHGRYLSVLAAPKRDFRREGLEQNRRIPKMPLKCLKPRLNVLARPKTDWGPRTRGHTCHVPPHECHCHVADAISKVTAGAKSYNPTTRIKALSQPKLDYGEVARCFPTRRDMCSQRRVIDPQASYRIKSLASPKFNYLCAPKRDPYGVRPEALNAVATRRTMLLAMPKPSFEQD